MNMSAQRIHRTRRPIAAALVISVLAGAGLATPVTEARAADGNIIILREVPARTAFRPGPGELPIRAEANPGADAKAAALGAPMQSGGWVGRELTNKDIASVVTGQGGVGGAGPMDPNRLMTNGVRDGAMSSARSAGRTPYSSAGAMLTGAPGGGGGVAGAVRGAVGPATSELTNILKGTNFGAR